MAKNMRKLFAIFMVVCMLVSALPMQALAAEDGTTTETETVTEAGLTTNVTTTTTQATDSESGKLTVTVEIQKDTTDENGNVVGSCDSTETVTTTTETAQDGTVTETVITEGSKTEERTEEILPGDELPDVTVGLIPGENTGSATTEPETTGQIVDGNGQTTTTTTQREVTANTSEITQVEGDGHGETVSTAPGVAPEEYTGKQEIFDEAYAGSENPNKDLFQYGGLYGGWDMASGWLEYIVEEVDEDGNKKYVLNLDNRPLDSDLIEGKVPEFLLIEHGERGAGSKVYVQKVEYELDADGNVVRDENGNPVYNLGKATGQTANQGILWGNDGNPYYVYSLCSDDQANVGYLMSGYEAEELSKSEEYKDDPEAQEHIRGIATHGYWGASNEADENGNYKTGSLAKIKAEMTAAVENGLVLELNGSTDKEAILAAIANLTEGDALVATQAALWSFSKGTAEDIDGETSKIVTGKFSNDTNGYTKLVYQYLMGITEKGEDQELVSIEKDSLNLTLGEKVGEKENSGVYTAALNFNLTIVPGENDELKVVLNYLDAEGVPQTVIRALGTETSDNSIAPNADGSYTLSGLKLSENQDIEFDLRLEGTQFLEDAVFVYSATHKNNIPGYENDIGPVGAQFSSLVGVGNMGAKVDTGLSFSVNFTVDEAKHVVVNTQWKSEDVTVIPPEAAPETPEEDPAEPYAPVLVNRLANDGVEIPEEPVPLATPAVTGDSTGLWIVFFLMIAMGLAAINLFDKKRTV